MSDIVNGMPAGGGWNAYRRNTTQRTAAATSDPMDVLLTSAARSGGYIPRGGHDGEASSTQLIALQKRDLVVVERKRTGNRHVIVGGRLTAKGFKAASILQEVAA